MCHRRKKSPLLGNIGSFVIYDKERVYLRVHLMREYIQSRVFSQLKAIKNMKVNTGLNVHMS